MPKYYRRKKTYRRSTKRGFYKKIRGRGDYKSVRGRRTQKVTYTRKAMRAAARDPTQPRGRKGKMVPLAVSGDIHGWAAKLRKHSRSILAAAAAVTPLVPLAAWGMGKFLAHRAGGGYNVVSHSNAAPPPVAQSVYHAGRCQHYNYKTTYLSPDTKHLSHATQT